MNRLMKNRRKSVVDELYLFIEREGIVITDEGYLIGYKRLRSDWTDCHSGTNHHTLGCIMRKDENEVDDNRRLACSTGLHVGSYDYVKTFHNSPNNPICKVLVNPKHVICVPECEADKMRVSKYEVLSIFKGDPMKGHYNNEGEKIPSKVSEFRPSPEDENQKFKNVHDGSTYTINDDDEIVEDIEWEDDDQFEYDCEDCGDEQCDGDCW